MNRQPLTLAVILAVMPDRGKQAVSGEVRQAKWCEKVKKDRDSYEAYHRKDRDRKAARRSAEYVMQERSRI